MPNVILFLFLSLLVPQKASRIDFGQGKIQNWTPINDDIIGGSSEGAVFYSPNSLILKGKIHLKKESGFSSVKGPILPIDLSAFSAVEVKVKTIGQNFAMVLENDRRFFVPYYRHSIKANEGEWTTVRLKLKNFKSYQLSRKIGEKVNPTILSEILRIGFISENAVEGEFNLEVDYIHFLE